MEGMYQKANIWWTQNFLTHEPIIYYTVHISVELIKIIMLIKTTRWSIVLY